MRHGVPEIEMNDDQGPQRQTNIPEKFDLRLFKCLGGNAIKKTRR